MRTTKSSHSPRAARRGGARKRGGANLSNRPKPKPPAALPAPAAPINAASPSTLARAEDNLTAKREVEVRRIPLAQPIRDCPRCANRHDTLEVKPLTRWPDGFTHFAICPNLGEPILLVLSGA